MSFRIAPAARRAQAPLVADERVRRGGRADSPAGLARRRRGTVGRPSPPENAVTCRCTRPAVRTKFARAKPSFVLAWASIRPRSVKKKTTVPSGTKVPAGSTTTTVIAEVPPLAATNVRVDVKGQRRSRRSRQRHRRAREDEPGPTRPPAAWISTSLPPARHWTTTTRPGAGTVTDRLPVPVSSDNDSTDDVRGSRRRSLEDHRRDHPGARGARGPSEAEPHPAPLERLLAADARAVQGEQRARGGVDGLHQPRSKVRLRSTERTSRAPTSTRASVPVAVTFRLSSGGLKSAVTGPSGRGGRRLARGRRVGSRGRRQGTAGDSALGTVGHRARHGNRLLGRASCGWTPRAPGEPRDSRREAAPGAGLAPWRGRDHVGGGFGSASGSPKSAGRAPWTRTSSSVPTPSGVRSSSVIFGARTTCGVIEIRTSRSSAVFVFCPKIRLRMWDLLDPEGARARRSLLAGDETAQEARLAVPQPQHPGDVPGITLGMRSPPPHVLLRAQDAELGRQDRA